MHAVLQFLPYIGYILAALMILVTVHELGHFLAAKLFGMRVEKFSVGFPPKVVGKQIGETEYVIGATPLGGYVKIAGMVDESLDTEGMASEPQPWEFRAKPVWQRIIVITAGVVFNLILAWIVFAALRYAYGEQYVPASNVQGVYVQPGSLAARIGLQTGDRIQAVGGQPLERYDDLLPRMLNADDLTFTVEREGRLETITGPRDVITQLNRTGGAIGLSIEPAVVGNVAEGSPADLGGLRPGDHIEAVGPTPVRFWAELTGAMQASNGEPVPLRVLRPDSLATPTDTALVAVDTVAGGKVYALTVQPVKIPGDSLFRAGVFAPTGAQLDAIFGRRERDYGLGEAIGAGATQTVRATRTVITSLTRIFTGRDAFRENLGGPLKVAKVVREEAAAGGAPAFWGIVAMLSITLAVMNILPIPALDGGHLVFLIYEGIVRREPSLKVRIALQQVGMVVLLVFMVFLFANDLLSFF